VSTAGGQTVVEKENGSMKNLGVLALAGLGLLGLMHPNARADEWDKKTVFTFSGPVEIPGMVLPAGTYVFKLMDSESDRNIVQVFNKDENHVYGTFLAIPDYRIKTPSKPIITFEERASDSPEAVKAWFYPGDNYGNEFVYPKEKAVQLARQTNQAVPSMPGEMASNTTKPVKTIAEPPVMAMKKTPLKAQKPSGEEVEIAQAFPPPPAQTASTPPPAKLPKRLPKTASQLSLIGLAGIVSLGAGLSLRAAAKSIG
jgi:hypothetical protein